jgi:hypothetical protein
MIDGTLAKTEPVRVRRPLGIVQLDVLLKAGGEPQLQISVLHKLKHYQPRFGLHAPLRGFGTFCFVRTHANKYIFQLARRTKGREEGLTTTK